MGGWGGLLNYGGFALYLNVVTVRIVAIHLELSIALFYLLQFYDILTKIFYNLQFCWPKKLSTRLQDLLKKTVDSTTKIGRNLQSTFTAPPLISLTESMNRQTE